MIALDGRALKSFGLSCEKHSHPLTPELTNRTLSVPGRDGLYFLGTDMSGRTHNFNLATIEKNKTVLQHNLRRFIAFLHNKYGNPRVIRLVYDYEPDKYYTVILSGKIDVDRVLRTGKFALSFASYDPYAYSVVLADEVLWGNTVITYMSSYLMGRGASDGLKTVTQPTALNILVDGLAIKPVIEITGTGSNVTIAVNGYSIEIGSLAGAAWIIDCDKYAVLKNGNNAFGEVSLRDFFLLPGSNLVAITGTSMDFAIHIKAQDKYI